MEEAESPELYLVLSNKHSKQSIGTYLRTASAFGVTKVVIVGSDKFSTHGAHRAQKYVDVTSFYEFSEAKEYLKARGCEILALKRGNGSIGINEKNFKSSVALVIDNEVPNYAPDQIAICDGFVHVPFHNTCSGPHKYTLDSTVAVSIILHHFAIWGNFTPRPIELTSTQGKFLLDVQPVLAGRNAKGDQIAAERERQRDTLSREAEEEGSMAFIGMFE